MTEKEEKKERNVENKKPYGVIRRI